MVSGNSSLKVRADTLAGFKTLSLILNVLKPRQILWLAAIVVKVRAENTQGFKTLSLIRVNVLHRRTSDTYG